MKILTFDFDNSEFLSSINDFGTIIRERLEAQENELVQQLLQGIDKEVFLEPSLSTYLLAQDEPDVNDIIQVLWCYSDRKEIALEIEVRSDRNGIIYLPRIAYYKGAPDTVYKVVYHNGTVAFTDEAVNGTREAFTYIGDSGIRLAKHVPPFLTSVIPAEFSSNSYEQAAQTLPKLENALDAIHALCPDLYDAICACTKELFVYDDAASNSFATIFSYGTGFINMEGQDMSDLFFIDDIAHQCGHVVYYAVTLRTNQYLKVQRNTPLKLFTGVENDTRELYGAFHGLFTYTTILACMDRFLDRNDITQDERDEALARVGFYMNKMRLDIAYLCSTAILTARGFSFMDAFRAGYDYIYTRYKKELQEYQYINQPYNFDMEVFLTDNVPQA